MPNVNEEGTWASTVGSETTIVDKTANKSYDFYIDTTNLSTGETLTLRLKIQIISTGGLIVKELPPVTETATSKCWRFPWESSPYHYRVTGQQAGGSTRNFDFILLDAT